MKKLGCLGLHKSYLINFYIISRQWQIDILIHKWQSKIKAFTAVSAFKGDTKLNKNRRIREKKILTMMTSAKTCTKTRNIWQKLRATGENI